MNREIKFRAWHISTKTMLSGEGAHGIFINAESDHGSASLNTTIKSLQKEYVLMQFTGLTDKNGKEVYEDDILKDGYETIFRVYGIAGGFAIKESIWQTNINDWVNTDILVASSLAHSLSYIEQSCEVIGNIHENNKFHNTLTP